MALLACLGIISVGSAAFAHQLRPRESATPPTAKDQSAKIDGARENTPESATESESELAPVEDFLKAVPTSNAQPSELRSQFNKLMSLARDQHDKARRDEHDAFSTQARTVRDTRFKELAEARTIHNSASHTVLERRDFMSSQDQARKKVFAEEEAKRNAFDKKFRERQKHFDDAVKAIHQTFEKSYQAFVKNYYERKKSDEEKSKADSAAQKVESENREKGLSDKQTPEERAIIREFEKQKKSPAIPLEPSDTY